ncbi:MAG: hypothetical protein EOS58_30595 [Mesorhizobium sp.]|nr:MAG: hypothetical protein EOS58_30595 [Mesorhizobium sp.]
MIEGFEGEDSTRAERVWFLIDVLREAEGSTVTICCDNPDFNGLPNSKVIICADWTSWVDTEFTGENVLEALASAHEAMFAVNPDARR